MESSPLDEAKNDSDKLEKLILDMLETAKDCHDADAANLLRAGAAVLTICLNSFRKQDMH